jgi:hypothetical protein
MQNAITEWLPLANLSSGIPRQKAGQTLLTAGHYSKD